MVHEPVQDRVAKRGVPDHVVPVFDGKLTGHERGAPAGAVLDEFEETANDAISSNSLNLTRFGGAVGVGTSSGD